MPPRKKAAKASQLRDSIEEEEHTICVEFSPQYEYPLPRATSLDPISFPYHNHESIQHTSQPASRKPTQRPTIKATEASEGGADIKFSWTPEMKEALFSALVEQSRRGKRADQGFKSEAWVVAFEGVNIVYKGTTGLTMEKCKSKESNYRALYKDWKWLIGQSGFGIHPETACVTASPEAWEEVIRVRILYLFL